MEAVSSNPSSSAHERGKDEWEVESETQRCYTSNCECWVVSRNGDRESRERRSDRYPLDPLESSQFFSFEAKHRYTPEVKFLGTFSNPLIIEDWICPDWYADLVIPSDDMIYIPPPPPPPSPATSTIILPLHLPLFSLTSFIRVPTPLDENGNERGRGSDGVVGVSYSLPLHPPPSKLIPSQKHPLPTTVFDAEMIGSCNGLYCLLSGPVPWGKEASVIVWNPTTGLSRPLPPFRCSERRVGPVFGFGYDQSTDDYKVVKIDADTRLVEVFSLYSNSNSNCNSWRSVQGVPQNIFEIGRGFSNGAVSFAGCLNWIVFPGPMMVASFDLATERFRFYSVPASFARCGSSLCILDGCLSLVALHNASRESGVSLSLNMLYFRVFDIWIMREYGVESSWTNAASIVFPYSVHTPFRILYLSKDVLILAVHDSMLLVFNLKENTLVCPHIRSAMTTGKGVEPYVQSEVSPYASSAYPTNKKHSTLAV